jgi:hypothetical protein
VVCQWTANEVAVAGMRPYVTLLELRPGESEPIMTAVLLAASVVVAQRGAAR